MSAALVWLGPYLSAGGYASVTRNYVKSLLAVGERPVIISTCDEQREALDAEEIEIYERHSRLEPLIESDVHLVVNLTPSDAVTVLTQLMPILERLHARVVRTAIVTIFETESLPASWLAPLERFDLVVVPSEFNLRTFEGAGVPREKLVKVPYALDLAKWYPAERDRSAKRFRFLYVCDFNFRKGIDVLVEAFCTAFSSDDDVELVLKTLRFFTHEGAGLAEVVEQHLRRRFGATAMRRLPRIVTDVGAIDETELRGLYQEADLYVSLDRANGWGMPVLEAMACGTPGAAIDYSGGAEILDGRYGYPIPALGLVPVDGRLIDESPIYAGQEWADVAVSAVASVLREAIEDPDRQRKIARGLEWVRFFDLEPIGEAFKKVVLEPLRS